jgi:uncharacterized UPF0160 family protein
MLSLHLGKVLACSMLKLLPRYKEATIVRSRDPAALAPCHIVVDVGGEYDPASHRYDHHQAWKTLSCSFLVHFSYP